MWQLALFQARPRDPPPGGKPEDWIRGYVALEMSDSSPMKGQWQWQVGQRALAVKHSAAVAAAK